MPLFSRAKNFEISGGTFAERLNIVNHFHGGHSGIDALLEASQPDATYNSAARTEAPRCHPGTREKFIKELVQWATPSALSINPPLLSWMKGYAGVGKSAVAQTCVERLKHMSSPCASFFFSINGRKDPKRLFPTIAYQLSLAIPEYHDILNKRISGDKSVLSKPLRGQFQGLIMEPLQQLTKKQIGSIKRIAIFIDGLDECQDKEAQCEIVEVVADAARWSTLPLCWAFFSRPEAHIEATFAQRHVAAVTHTVDLRVSRDDDGEIEGFLRDSFEKMLRRRNMPQGYAWPSKTDMQELVDAADGLFIYAGAASRFIDDPKWPEPQIPLRLVLDSARGASKRSTDGASQSPFAELDALYVLIMQNIPLERLPLTSLFLTLLSLEHEDFLWFGQGRIMMQSNLLGISEFQYRAICSDLCSVLRIREKSDRPPIAVQLKRLRFWFNSGQRSRFTWIRIMRALGGFVDFYHKSFVDFLVDPTRSDQYCISTPSAYVNLLVHISDIYLAYESGLELDSAGFILPVKGNASKTMLSFPHTHKLTNSILPVLVLYSLSRIWEEAISRIHATCDRINLYQRLSEWNFRKLYAVRQRMYDHGCNPFFISFQLECRAQIDFVKRAELLTLHNPEFTDFDVVRFKKIVEDQLRGGLLHRSVYISSRKVDEQHCESGLFVLGHDEKSVFWYWEIDFEEKVYREFHAPDLDEGMNAFEQYHSIKPPSRSWLSTLIRR
ncbi:hypothetical protein D9756_007785 [Leucocoprinus leucothites]|uniref:Nephrocystin 3-like N-terminal domain-containing protein n=1 Tax=Leucocoprinus leucothites TaxID=201217 RepID=A0A8H5D4W4_9AGAR|nr:hypothetical protein D9756_007785 [Leucoagaricus leucothites]